MKKQLFFVLFCLSVTNLFAMNPKTSTIKVPMETDDGEGDDRKKSPKPKEEPKEIKKLKKREESKDSVTALEKLTAHFYLEFFDAINEKNPVFNGFMAFHNLQRADWLSFFTLLHENFDSKDFYELDNVKKYVVQFSQNFELGSDQEVIEFLHKKFLEYFLQHLDRSADARDKIFADLVRSFMRFIVRACEKEYNALCFDIYMGRNRVHKKNGFDGNFFEHYLKRCTDDEKERTKAIDAYLVGFKSSLRKCYIACGMLDARGLADSLQKDQELINAYFTQLKKL